MRGGGELVRIIHIQYMTDKNCHVSTCTNEPLHHSSKELPYTKVDKDIRRCDEGDCTFLNIQRDERCYLGDLC